MFNCLFVLCLEYIIVLFVPDFCILECVYCEEMNVEMCKVPIHSSTPRGEVSGLSGANQTAYDRRAPVQPAIGRAPSVYF